MNFFAFSLFDSADYTVHSDYSVELFPFLLVQFPALRDFVKMGKPVWGTCAGLIFLANKVVGGLFCNYPAIDIRLCSCRSMFFSEQGTIRQKIMTLIKVRGLSFTGQKSGGQGLIGGLDCTVHRNFFGSQVSLDTRLIIWLHFLPIYCLSAQLVLRMI